MKFFTIKKLRRMSQIKPHNHQRLHDPRVIGPGLWFWMHSKAARAITLIAKQRLIEDIRELQEDFPCKECKGHFAEYLEHHPPEISLDGDEKSLFYWTVDFHNDRNAATLKAQVSYRDAEDIYFNNSVECETRCEADIQGLEEEINFTIHPMK